MTNPPSITEQKPLDQGKHLKRGVSGVDREVTRGCEQRCGHGQHGGGVRAAREARARGTRGGTRGGAPARAETGMKSRTG